MRQLIVTADDFGASLEVNQAVELAHRQGILTAASLMVGAPAAADAVERARRLPRLGVGLHIVLVCGRPVLDPSLLSTLVGRDGQFLDNLVEAGIRFFFSPMARKQLESEIRAQFESFHATGLELDHVNAHNHMHLHPTVMNLIVKVGREYGLRAVRLPRQPPQTGGCSKSEFYSFSHREKVRMRGYKTKSYPFYSPHPNPLPVGEGAFAIPQTGETKRWWSGIGPFFLSGWIALLRRRLERDRLRHNDFIFGMDGSGNMNAARLAEILKRLPAGVSEIYFHPATARGGQPFPDEYRPDEELAALLDEDIAAMIESEKIRRINFRDLARA